MRQSGFRVPADLEAEVDELITHYPREAQRVADGAARDPGTLRLDLAGSDGVDGARSSICSRSIFSNS